MQEGQPPPREVSSMKIKWKSRDIVVTIPGLAQSGVPVMRLQAYHSPQLRIEVKIGKKQHTLAALADLDWSHEGLSALNAPTVARAD